MSNCVEIVRPFSEAVTGRSDIQLIGGIGSAALNHPETVIVPEEKRIVAPANLNLPQYRPDKNLRDFDVLVLSADPETVGQVGYIAEHTIGDQLEISVFDLKPIERLLEMQAHPAKGLKQFVSDRYAVEMSKYDLRVVRRALFPFWVEMHPETLETWQLFVGEQDKYPSPIPHPGSVIINYLTRSISGLRAKDEDKVAGMSDAIIDKAPDIKDWIIDGPGASQMEMAEILQRLSRRGKLKVGQHLEVSPAAGDLTKRASFILPDAFESVKKAVLDVTYAKSRLVRHGESQTGLVTFWQKYVEGTISAIVHND